MVLNASLFRVSDEFGMRSYLENIMCFQHFPSVSSILAT